MLGRVFKEIFEETPRWTLEENLWEIPIEIFEWISVRKHGEIVESPWKKCLNNF